MLTEQPEIFVALIIGFAGFRMVVPLGSKMRERLITQIITNGVI